MIERPPEFFIRHVLPDHSHVFVASVGHGVSHEPERVCQRFLWFFKPYDTARRFQRLRSEGKRFHKPSP